eukprot:TRINITY_DN17573_c0_g1_i1.p1 TRINITY_DN17573_c0_g1~~TRINITY_DN17573_c0_g1_i1.p1  ORF type:complete len:475 (-),score=131.55 TRINITY_DN17573_c0_g1_i1:232-1656(-)
MSNIPEDVAETNVEQFKIRKLIKTLEAARGNGTSLISLMIRPQDQISRCASMLAQEYGTASCIKSRVTRLAVLSAISSTQQKLKLYTRVPANGLVIYCGNIETGPNKMRKVNIDLVPYRPINTSMYLCDSRFHTEPLAALLESEEKFGFIIVDGGGALYGALTGNTREIMHQFTVDLPKKHGRGGQSALRFARLRLEKRHNYLRKVSEIATQIFITNDRPNVCKLVLAGLADFKTELSESDLFDPRLRAVLLKMVDISYGGESGFNQAIELCAEDLRGVKFIEEKKLISTFFDEIAHDSGKYSFGVGDTLKACEMGAAQTLIVWENLSTVRHTLKHPTTGEVSVQVLPHGTEPTVKVGPVGGDKAVDLEVVEAVPLVEWLAINYKKFGAHIEFVTDRSQEGSQFVRGFGGIGAILRYRVDFLALEGEVDNGEAVEDDDAVDYDEFDAFGTGAAPAGGPSEGGSGSADSIADSPF